MRDLTEIIDEFHSAGLISDEFVEKLADDLSHLIRARGDLVKQAWGEEIGQALGAAGNMIGAMAPNLMHKVKGFFGMNPTLGQRIAGGLGSMMEHPLGQHLVIGGALGGAQLIKNVLTKAMDNMTMNSSYSQMMQQFPDLQKADPTLVHRTFQVVQQYAPSVAKNPTVSGTFVKGILQYPDAAVTPDHVRSLVEVERQMSALNQPGLIGEMASGAAQSLGRSAVQTFAPDPLRLREVKVREEEAARHAAMEPWQKAQMAMNMLGTGTSMMGTGVSAAKNIHEMRQPGQMDIEREKARLRDAPLPGTPVESLSHARDAYMQSAKAQGIQNPQEPDIHDLITWMAQSGLRPGRR